MENEEYDKMSMPSMDLDSSKRSQDQSNKDANEDEDDDGIVTVVVSDSNPSKLPGQSTFKRQYTTETIKKLAKYQIKMGLTVENQDGELTLPIDKEDGELSAVESESKNDSGYEDPDDMLKNLAEHMVSSGDEFEVPQLLQLQDIKIDEYAQMVEDTYQSIYQRESKRLEYKVNQVLDHFKRNPLAFDEATVV